MLSWINFHIESFDRRNSENINLAGISLRTNNIILPPLLLRSSLIGLLKRLILNWRWGNHSSSLISEIIKRSTFPLTEICFEMSFYSRVQLWVFFNVPYEESLKYYNLFRHQLILTYFPRFLKRNPCQLLPQVMNFWIGLLEAPSSQLKIWDRAFTTHK